LDLLKQAIKFADLSLKLLTSGNMPLFSESRASDTINVHLLHFSYLMSKEKHQENRQIVVTAQVLKLKAEGRSIIIVAHDLFRVLFSLAPLSGNRGAPLD
jgi:hypothetical protein